MPITYDSGTNTITVTGYTESSPCTFEDLYNESVNNGWGVVEKQGDKQYLVKAKLVIGDGSTETWFKDVNKQILFDISGLSGGDTIIYVHTNAHFISGDVYNEEKRIGWHGCNFHVNNPSIFVWFINVDSGISEDGVQLYSSRFSSEYVAYLRTYGRIWSCIIDDEVAPYWNMNIFDVTIKSKISYGMYNVFPLENGYVERVIVRGNAYPYRADLTYRDVEFREITNLACNYSAYITYPRNNLYTIDCVDPYNFDKPVWYETDYSLVAGWWYVQFSFDILLIDKDGNPIAGAEVYLYDKNGDLVIHDVTGADGRLVNAPYVVTWKRLQPSDTCPSSGVCYDSKVEYYTPHTLKIIKEGYADFEAKIIIDRKYYPLQVVMNPYTYTLDDIYDLLKKHDAKMTALGFVV